MLKAVFFDLDGTLADTEILHFEGWSRIFEKYGKPITKEYYAKNLIGRGKNITNELIPKEVVGEDREKRKNEIYREKIDEFLKIVDKSKSFQPAVAFAKSLKGKVIIAIVTTTAREQADAILKAIGMADLFDFIVTGSDVKQPKPFPDVYNLAIEKAGVHPTECVTFEDTPSGIEAAKTAGVKAVAVPNENTKKMDFSKADMIIKSFSDISFKSIQDLTEEVRGPKAGISENLVRSQTQDIIEEEPSEDKEKEEDKIEEPQIELKIKAALFDLEGLLTDTEPLHFDAWRQIFEKHGEKLSKRYYSVHYVGKRDHIVAGDLIPKRIKGEERDKKVQELMAEKAAIFLALAPKAKPFKEAIEFVKLLKGKTSLAIVTSTHREEAEAIIKSISVKDFFDIIITGSDVKNVKPAPDVYLLAMQKLGVNPHECIVFEDSQSGIEAAKAAGIACVAIPNTATEGMDFSKANTVVKSFSKLSLESINRIVSGKFSVVNEDEIMNTIVKGFDWEDVLTSIVVEHGLDPENISISKLADSFITYLHKTEFKDFRIPARFVLVAAILLSMKVEAVLQEEEERLSGLDTSALNVQLEAPLLIPPSERTATRPVNLTDLISALNKAFEIKEKKEPFLHKPPPKLPIPPQKPKDIELRVKELYDKIQKKGIMKFSDLVPVWKRADIIYAFLPMLYLAHRGKIECRQDKLFREITIKLR